MKKFVLKSILFTLPFLVLYPYSYFYFNKNSRNDDLIRIGYLPIQNKQIGVFENQVKRYPSSPLRYSLLSERPERNNFDILTIGDSFSEQKSLGYQNALSYEFSVLHVDRFIGGNRLQTLFGLINGGFFDQNHFKYVVLEIVERSFYLRGQGIDTTAVIESRAVDSLIRVHANTRDEESGHVNLFSRTVLAFPWYNASYYLRQNYLSNGRVYNYQLTSDSLFENKSDKLLFYVEDVQGAPFNNDPENVAQTNDYINRLAQKLRERGVQLVLLPAPDKFDIYYHFLSKKDLTEPKFFQILSSLQKDYIHINSKKLLVQELRTTPELYLWGDSHWSAEGVRIISRGIKDAINP